jgi:hypothetical protein
MELTDSGLSRIQRLGAWKKLAALEKQYREYRPNFSSVEDGRISMARLRDEFGEGEGDELVEDEGDEFSEMGDGTQALTEDEREFIRAYLESGASADPDEIRESIESNRDEFTDCPTAGAIIEVIQFVYWIQRASWVRSETDIRRQAEGNGLPPELVLQIV